MPASFACAKIRAQSIGPGPTSVTSGSSSLIGGAVVHFAASGRMLLQSLHVDHRKPAGILLEPGYRILTRRSGPAQIQLDLDERGIAGLEDQIERGLTFDGHELEVVVVIGELESRPCRPSRRRG